ncbi:PKD domain-containing protein [Flaviaesturariibacter amylovorans]|uniref:PKD domain-containing protein n=1 Tax=Flaviaesturariibacter amylovorans TaxID=1084520 RepID=A0ABP8GJS2_9BACT
MTQLFRLVLSVLFLVAGFRSTAQNVTNRGKEFWVGYGHHQYMEPGFQNDQDMVLYFSAEAQAAQVKVTIRGRGATTVNTYNVAANTVVATPVMPKSGTNDVRLYDVPPSFGGNGGEGLYNMSIHIESNVPIVAYAHIYASVSSGATMLLPVDAWGYQYTSINSQQINAGGPGFSWVYVIAKEDNTVIEINPKVATRLGKPANVPFRITMNKGQIYQFIGQSDAQGNGNQFTGTTVKSIANGAGVCNPIAVFSGSSRTQGEQIPCANVAGRDNDMQQAFPAHAWGKRYLTAPFVAANNTSANQTCYYKIVARDPGTTVRRNTNIITPNAAGYWEFSSNQGELIEADKPIMVAQFMAGSGSSTCNPSSGQGDPEMVFLSPVEQAIKSVGFYRNTKQSITSNFVTVIIPATGVASLVIDGVQASTLPQYTHPRDANYKVVTRRWTAAPAQALMSSSEPFNAITYGMGSAESYAYNAGTFLKNLNAVADIHNELDTSVKTHAYTCPNTPVELSALMAYKPTMMVWKLSTLAGIIDPSADVAMANPTPIDSTTINNVKYYKYRLPGTYKFNRAGTFLIPIDATNNMIANCAHTEPLFIEVTVNPGPVAAYNFNHTGCTTDTIRFAAVPPPGFNMGKYVWSFNPGDSTRPNRDTLFAPGTYDIKLTVVTNEGCVDDTTRTVVVGGRPSADFTMAPSPVCEGGSVTFTNPTGGTPPAGASWYWDFGNGSTPVTLNANTPQTINYPSYGTYTVRHVYKATANCLSDTVSKVLTVYAKPRPNFTYSPTGCLPADSIVTFTSTTTIPDGQAATSYYWDFGDPAATAQNPNTSTLANPSHKFGIGTYNIKFSVTTAQGCIKDTTIILTFQTGAAISWPPLPAVCSNASGTVSIATAVVTNGVPGSGTYGGPGVSPDGTFNPAVAGPGTHTVTYSYLPSGGGCATGASNTITVAARPRPAFTIPAGGCLVNDTVTLTNTSTVSDGATLTYLWNFGDPAATATNPNTSTAQHPTHVFGTGTYNIKLTVTSSSGCVADTTITAEFKIQPDAQFPALPAVCENGAAFSVATASVTNGVPGTGVYSGPGTDAAGNFNPAAAAIGPNTITYIFTSTAGCADTVTSIVNVKPRPRPTFTGPAGGCFTDGVVTFANGTTIADGSALTYSWNFGDPAATGANPNTSTATNGTHTFGTGTYNVQLSATSANGCSADTTITFTFSIAPAATYPALAAVCENMTGTVSVATASVTNGVPGTGVYSGPGVDAAGNFTPSAVGAGTYTITYIFTAPSGCADTVTSQIQVKPRPRPNFTVPGGGCLDNGLVTFPNTTTIADGSAMTYSWNFGDPAATGSNPNTSTAVNGSHNFATGTYNIQLTATSANGCSADTTITATFSIKPQLAWTNLADVCVNGSPVSVATALVTNNVPGAGTYSGTGVNAAGQFDPAMAGVGTHELTYTFVSAANCTVTITRNITVKPRPFVNFTYPPGGCLTDGTVTFTNTTTINPASPMTYVWDFGDAAATPGNPNTSTATNGTHVFGNGTYNIKLTATAANGCAADTTITATFSIKPQLAWPQPADLCVNGAAASYATASVTNGVTGTGVYSGTGIDANGNFNPATAGVGPHTLTYTFTSSTGCQETITRTVTVKPRPFVNFTYPAGGCLVDGTVTFTNTTTISPASALTYAWDFGDAAATPGNPNTSTATNGTHVFGNGTYNIKLTATAANGCVADTTIAATFSIKPQLAWPQPADLCVNGTATSFATATVTNSVAGTGTYSGIGIDASGNFNPATAGVGPHTLTYTYTSNAGCIETITRTVTVKPRPFVNFTYPPGGCLVDGTVTFTNTTTINPASPMTWAWDFGDAAATPSNPNTSTAQNGSHVFGNGTYNIKLTANAANGCSAYTTITATFSIQPQLAWAQPADLCVNEAATSFATATVTNSVTGTGVYSGTGIDAAGNFNPATAGVGPHTLTYTFTSTAGCVETITRTVNVKARPFANFSSSAGSCLVDGTVTFTNSTTPVAGSTLSYAWNFGDAMATPSNPNTSTAANPTHVFGTGSYNIQLTATASNGCSGDTTITMPFSIKPQLSFGPLTAVCANATGTYSVAYATVTNGVAGTGVYSGPGTDAAGNFNPAAANVGPNTISYTFTSAAGCQETITSTITVHPKPTALFTASADICIDGVATVTDASTISSGAIATWNWDLGNGNTPSNSTGGTFTVPYPSTGPATIRLTVVSDQGCVSDPYTRTLTVHPLPVADFSLPASVCMPGGVASMASTSTVGDGSTLSYVWNFGDASPNATGASVSHVYAATGSYTITLTATSAWGCVSDTSKVLSAFYDKPVVDFTMNAAELCQGVESVFTDISTAPNSTIASRQWTFANGKTDTAAIARTTFATPGTYQVRLRVTNGVGCTADTVKPVIVHLQPKVDAGPSFVVPVGTQVRFNPTVNSSTLNFQWTPGGGLSGANTLRPTMLAQRNATYYLTATGAGGCTASDSLTVKILLPVKIPNAFSPNGDGQHDTWAIESLKDYPGATVEVFNRYGQRVYFSNGYSVPWDGRYNGSLLPFATYYYVIVLQNGFAPITGTITIIK